MMPRRLLVGFSMLVQLLVVRLCLTPMKLSSGIYVSLQGFNYSNNSLVNLTEVENNKVALMCHTDIVDCCARSSSISSDWYFPDGSKVEFRSGSNQDSFNRDRKNYSDGGSVNLYRNTSSKVVPPNGIFSCIINDSSTILEFLVGIYNTSEGHPKIDSLDYQYLRGILTCVSSGGPASEVIWNRSGPEYQTSQEMLNGTSATYHNKLFITGGNLSDYSGKFICTVSNSRGETRSMTKTFKSIELLIQVNMDGSRSITCYSNLTVQTIKLFKESGEEKVLLRNLNVQQSLTTSVSSTESNLNYTITCEINIILPGNRIVTVQMPPTTPSQPGSNNKRNEGDESVVFIEIIIGVIIVIIVIIIVIVILILFTFMKKRSKSHSQDKADLCTNGMSSSFTHNESDNNSLKEQETKILASIPAQVNTLVNEKAEGSNFTCVGETRLKPIPLSEFRQHVEYLQTEKNKKFESEFDSIEKSLQEKFTAASKNQEKNRFKNIKPYDFNRVILSTSSDSSSDYINASYIKGYDRDKVYIAAQGPIENTEEDFWRMILENHIPTVVMLTRVFEGKKKCQQYWPLSLDETYIPQVDSAFSVKLNSTLPYADFSINELTVSKTGERSHQLTLYHYTAWPDHGVPTNAMSMISFNKMVRKRHPYSTPDPVLVHCSAGVGRTGSFITLDYMLERIKTEPTINVYEFVTNLRKQRMLMVQTMDQYIFIHTALNELLTCGETEIAAGNLRMEMQKLDKREKKDSPSGFEEQFNVLQDVTSNLANVEFSEARNKENKSLNRYKSNIPYNHTRVILRAATAQGSTYINASFVGGYRNPGAYIVTQGPLPHTVGEFWRMVTEQDVKCVVMLCRLKEDDKEVCHQYWPGKKGSPEEFGQFVVTMASQDIQTGYIVRKLEAVDKLKEIGKNSASVIHIQYLQWPAGGIPTTTSTVLEIANLVQKVQMGTGNKPIVVMCNDSTNRSGAFLTIHAQMERLKAEGVVDIFQFIKSIRCHRAGLVTNKDQYKFCHEALADFLDGFDTYANFKQT